MSELHTLPPAELRRLRDELSARYQAFVARGLKLDMTRGKPAAAQLDLARALASALGADDIKASDGTDIRNYGGLDGLPEMRALFGEILGAPSDQVIVGGNSSLQMMHDTVVRALLHGVPGGKGPWLQQKTKFLCPSPGYDRHFAICEHHGIEMIPVDLLESGPDMDAVRGLVATDDAIRGMWCVPKYSNPTGITYSDDVVQALSTMPTAAPDFRIFWDNAYVVHDLYETTDPLSDLLVACEKAGNPNRVFVFCSTSKITLAGAGIAAMASSRENIADAKKHAAIQTIGPDKVNQLRHLRFLGNMAGVLAHMRQHATILRPKFEAVISSFERNLGGKGIAEYTKPRGGYFVSLDTKPGCAKKVVSMAEKAGVKLTSAGATFPLGHDPRDRNIRIAPSLPPLEQVELAMDVVSVCVELAAVEQLIERT
jgi:DNA-binding transcriptional MocR family regulator